MRTKKNNLIQKNKYSDNALVLMYRYIICYVICEKLHIRI